MITTHPVPFFLQIDTILNCQELAQALEPGVLLFREYTFINNVIDNTVHL